METVEVLASVLLETMRKSLGLPSPRYEHISAGGAHFETKLLFYPSMEFIQSLAKPHSLSSLPEDNLEEATNIAAIRAIKYMKTKENKVLKDFSYEELQREKKVNRALVRQMEAKDLKSYKRTRQLRDTADAYDNYMDAIRDATRRIQKLVSDHGKRGTVLLDIKAVADDLDQFTSQSNTQLNAIGGLPSEPDDVEDVPSTGYYETDDEYTINGNSKHHDYDSDGRPTYYDV